MPYQSYSIFKTDNSKSSWKLDWEYIEFDQNASSTFKNSINMYMHSKKVKNNIIECKSIRKLAFRKLREIIIGKNKLETKATTILINALN